MTVIIFSYYAAVLVMTVVLFWGLTIIAAALKPGSGGEPFSRSILSEEPDPSDPDVDKKSFSRTAGAFGAMGLAMAVVGIAYWVLYALFFFPEQLNELKNVWPFFLSGSALFAPYAFNRLASIFRPEPTRAARVPLARPRADTSA